MSDILIAGGGIAGSALAILLGRQGRSVELFEQAAFPRDKACGEGLMPAGVGVLDRLGLKQRAGGIRFAGVRYHFGSRSAEGAFPRGGAQGIGQRRIVLDTVLFNEAANTPGVIAHTGACVERPIVDKGRVAGLVVDGESRYAKLVVAADGVRSRLRRVLGLDVPPRRHRIGILAHFRLAADHCQPPWVEVFACPGYELYVTPLPDRQLLVAALADSSVVLPPAHRTFERWWQSHPVLSKRLDGARQVSPFRGVSPLSTKARRGVGAGFALLGDAAGFVDPVTGGGMAQALMCAELLAGHMPQTLDTDDAWLWRFETARKRMLRNYQFMTSGVLWLSYHREIAEKILSVLRFAPHLFSRLLVLAGGYPAR